MVAIGVTLKCEAKQNKRNELNERGKEEKEKEEIHRESSSKTP
jgi:hypothetical protein